MSEPELSAIVDSLQDGIVAYDEHERVVFFNPAAQRILGVPREELESGRRTWVPLGTDGSPLPGEQRPVAITARTGQPCRNVDIGVRRGDGSTAWTIVSTQALGERPGRPGATPWSPRSPT
jgi:PAS domain S-box-containing protein